MTIRYNTLKRSIGPTITVRKAIRHPNYNSNSLNNDIAVLILSSEFIPDKNAKTIEILRSSDPKPGSTVTVSGWGKTASNGNVAEDLQVANLTVVDRSKCGNFSPIGITRNMICASDPTKSACNVSIA